MGRGFGGGERWPGGSGLGMPRPLLSAHPSRQVKGHLLQEAFASPRRSPFLTLTFSSHTLSEPLIRTRCHQLLLLCRVS